MYIYAYMHTYIYVCIGEFFSYLDHPHAHLGRSLLSAHWMDMDIDRDVDIDR